MSSITIPLGLLGAVIGFFYWGGVGGAIAGAVFGAIIGALIENFA